MSQQVSPAGLERHRLFNDPTFIFEARLFSRDYDRKTTGAECCRIEGLWEWCETTLNSPWLFHEGHDGGSFWLTSEEDATLLKLFWGDRLLFVRDPYNR